MNTFGPRSAVYGSDAIGGVVNIITTRDQTAPRSMPAWVQMATRTTAAARSRLSADIPASPAGDYTYTKGFDVVAEGNTGGVRQPDRDGFMSKTIYGALEHSFSNEWSGFVRGYGYDNRTAYDGSPYGGVLVDTRQLYSQTWDAGLRFNQDIFHSQLTSSYSHSKDYNYDPRLGRYDTSATLDEVKQYNVQWANTVDVGHGNVGAGIDWQNKPPSLARTM